MAARIVVTLTGPDRVGIVEDVTRALLGVGGNVESSRMARLGGEFAIIMLVALPGAHIDRVNDMLAPLAARGYTIGHHVAGGSYGEPHADWDVYEVSVEGADHEGIVHGIAAGLSEQGISIESMETGIVEAPVTGAQLFTMRATVVVPPDVADSDWIAVLGDVGNRVNVDVEVAKVAR